MNIDEKSNQMAMIITNKLFALGNEPKRPTTRIQFKHKIIDAEGEVGQGGMCKLAFELWLKKMIQVELLTL